MNFVLSYSANADTDIDSSLLIKFARQGWQKFLFLNTKSAISLLPAILEFQQYFYRSHDHLAVINTRLIFFNSLNFQ